MDVFGLCLGGNVFCWSADRDTSFAVLDAARYRAAPEEERARIAAGFFNDLFWFDQMACSSPHVLFWVGPPEAGATAAREFERDLQAEVTRR